MHCIVLYCLVLYFLKMFCFVLHCIKLYCTVLYCIVLFCIILYCTTCKALKACEILLCNIWYVDTSNLLWWTLDGICLGWGCGADWNTRIADFWFLKFEYFYQFVVQTNTLTILPHHNNKHFSFKDCINLFLLLCSCMCAKTTLLFLQIIK